MAPAVLANMSSSKGRSAVRIRSNERFFFSKVTVTASTEGVPNKTATAATPGSSARMLSRLPPDLTKNIPCSAA